MDTYSWILCGLAAFDVLIVSVFFLLRHAFPVMDRQSCLIMAIAMSGFVFHAVLFFEGAILFLQLTLIAVLYIGLTFWPLKGPNRVMVPKVAPSKGVPVDQRPILSPRGALSRPGRRELTFVFGGGGIVCDH